MTRPVAASDWPKRPHRSPPRHRLLTVPLARKARFAPARPALAPTWASSLFSPQLTAIMSLSPSQMRALSRAKTIWKTSVTRRACAARHERSAKLSRLTALHGGPPRSFAPSCASTAGNLAREPQPAVAHRAPERCRRRWRTLTRCRRTRRGKCGAAVAEAISIARIIMGCRRRMACRRIRRQSRVTDLVDRSCRLELRAAPPQPGVTYSIGRAPGPPDVDAAKQEQPNHVDEMPVPGGELEPDMVPGVNWPLSARMRQTKRKITPIMTCAP